MSVTPQESWWSSPAFPYVVCSVGATLSAVLVWAKAGEDIWVILFLIGWIALPYALLAAGVTAFRRSRRVCFCVGIVSLVIGVGGLWVILLDLYSGRNGTVSGLGAILFPVVQLAVVGLTWVVLFVAWLVRERPSSSLD
jgi:hypothetical protein